MDEPQVQSPEVPPPPPGFVPEPAPQAGASAPPPPPPGFVPEEPAKPDFTATGVATGAGKEALDTAKGMATTVFPGQGNLVGELEAMPAVFRAYEQARQSGKGIMESVSAANDEAKRQDDARNVIKQRAAEFATKPDEATGRLLTDAVMVLLGKKFGGAKAGEVEGAEAAEAAPKTTPKPGLIKQVVKGENVVQPEVQQTLKGVGNLEEPSIRESLSKPIEEARTNKEALYKSYDEAAGVDRKALQERLENTQDQMSKLTGTAGDMKRLARLKEAESSLKDTIAEADRKAEAAGIKISDADAANTKLRALEDVEKNIFKNQEVVKGNAAQGEPEHVNVDNAIKAIQKMKDNEKFGGPRWDQAFGEGSADEVLSKLRDYRATGKSALSKQNFAKMIGRNAAKALGFGLLYEGGKELLQ